MRLLHWNWLPVVETFRTLAMDPVWYFGIGDEATVARDAPGVYRAPLPPLAFTRILLS